MLKKQVMLFFTASLLVLLLSAFYLVSGLLVRELFEPRFALNWDTKAVLSFLLILSVYYRSTGLAEEFVARFQGRSLRPLTCYEPSSW